MDKCLLELLNHHVAHRQFMLENGQEVLQGAHKENSRRIKDVCNIIGLSQVAHADAFWLKI